MPVVPPKVLQFMQVPVVEFIAINGLHIQAFPSVLGIFKISEHSHSPLLVLQTNGFRHPQKVELILV